MMIKILTAIKQTFLQLIFQGLAHLMLINVQYPISSKGHWELHNEIGTQSILKWHIIPLCYSTPKKLKKWFQSKFSVMFCNDFSCIGWELLQSWSWSSLILTLLEKAPFSPNWFCPWEASPLLFRLSYKFQSWNKTRGEQTHFAIDLLKMWEIFKFVSKCSA